MSCGQMGNEIRNIYMCVCVYIHMYIRNVIKIKNLKYNLIRMLCFLKIYLFPSIKKIA